MNNYLSIIENDIFLIKNIDELFNIYNSADIKNKPFAIIICIHGEMCIEINLKQYKLLPNQIMIHTPYHSKIASYSVSPDFKARILCLSEKAIVEYFNMSNYIWEKSFAMQEEPVIDINKEVASLFKSYGRLFYIRESMPNRLYQKEVTISLLKAIIYEILSEINNSETETPGKHLLTQGEILFKKFITLLSNTKIKPRMVTWYAQQLHVTPKYLSTTCKNVSGKTANVWINQFVITDISQMLRYSEKSIKEISEHLNFPNLSFFGKYVKAHLGVSPKEYRLQQRNVSNQ